MIGEDLKDDPSVRPRWQALWSLDLRSLALLRILYGWIVLLDLAVRLPDLQAHYTDIGVAPRAAVLQLEPHIAYWSFYFLNGSTFWALLLFTLTAVSALCMMVGYKTRPSSVLCYALVISLQTRNPMVVDAGDMYLRCIFFWCLFLPWGARWSVDANRSALKPGSPETHFSAAALAYRMQLSLIYWVAVLLKSGVEWRQEGSAVYYALSLEHIATPLAPVLLAQPGVMSFLTFSTLWFEALGPILFWMPGHWRTLGVLGFVCMHLGFAAFLHLGVFGWIAVCSSVALLPPEFWARTSLHQAFGKWSTWISRKWPWVGHHSCAQAAPIRSDAMIIALLAAYVLVWNLTTIPSIRLPFTFWEVPGRALRIDQRWGMFSPHPSTQDGWYVIEGTRLDGTHVDLFRHGRAVSWEKPKRMAAEYPNARWRKYLSSLAEARLSAWRPYYGAYLARRWNSRHTGSERVSSFRIYFMLEETLPAGVAPVKKLLLWTQDCI
jgi:hypothetical protein